MTCLQKVIFFLFLVGVGGGVTSYQLAHSTWGYQYFTHSLTRLIEKNTPIKNPHLSYKKISWGGIYHPFSLSMDDVELISQERKITIEKVYLGWLLRDIVHFQFFPCHFSFKDTQVNGENTPFLSLDLSLYFHPGKVEITLHRFHIIPENFPPFIPYMTSFRLPIEGSGHIHFTPHHLLKLHLLFSSKEGVLALPSFFPIPLSLPTLTGEIILATPHHLKAHIKTIVENIPLNTEVEVILPSPLPHFWEKGGMIELKTFGRIQNVSVDHLPNLWPISLSPKPRKWVTENLSKGEIEGTLKATVRATFQPYGQLYNLRVEELSGTLDPQGVTVKYLGDLPHVEETSAHCIYTNKRFIIEKINGKVANGLTIKESHIVIDDLDKEDQLIHIALDVLGGVDRLFNLISLPPLSLLQKLGLSLKHPKGDSTTHLTLDFPLETNVTLDQIQVGVGSHITNASTLLPHIIPHYPIDLKKGDFHLISNGQELFLQGTAEIDQSPLTFEWKEYFQKSKNPSARYIHLKARKSLMKGDSNSPFIKGYLPLDLRYEEKKRGDFSLDLKAVFDQTEIHIPWFNYHKKKGERGSCELSFEGMSHKGFSLQKGFIKGKDLNIDIQGQWTPKNKSIATSAFYVGKTFGFLGVTENKKRPHLKGNLNQIDLSSLIKSGSFLKEESLIVPSFDADLSLNVGTLHFSKDYHIENATLLTQFIKGQIQTVDFKDKKDQMHLAITPYEKGAQTLSFETMNVGELIELLAPGNELVGGEMNFTGIFQKDQPFLKGEVDIQNIIVHKAPALAKILSLSSVEGILTFLSGQGIKFDQGHGYITWKPGEFLVNDSHLIGKSLGLTFNGDIKNNQVHFIGEIIPFYSLNHILSQLPLVGKILRGYSNHAVFSTPFILKGDWKNTNIEVQPLTTLAPGMVRRFFD